MPEPVEGAVDSASGEAACALQESMRPASLTMAGAPQDAPVAPAEQPVGDAARALQSHVPVHSPFASFTADGEAALLKLLQEVKAPDTLKLLSERSPAGMRLALRVAWPTFKSGKPSSFRQRGSGASGNARPFSTFQCRLVDVRGESCLFRVFVDGEDSSPAVAKCGQDLMERFFPGSAWIVSELVGVARLASASISGCTVQYSLTGRLAPRALLSRFTAVMQNTPLERALPHVPLPTAGLTDLEQLRERRLVDLCLRLVEVGPPKQRANSVVRDCTFVDEHGSRATVGLWGADADLAEQSRGKVLYAYDVLVLPGDDGRSAVLEKLSLLPSSKIHVPKETEYTAAASRLLEVDPAGASRDLVPVYGGQAYDYEGQAFETTAGALDASLPVPGAMAGERLDLPDQELYEIPGALVLPDLLGPEANARTRDGARLFCAAQLVDLSGSCSVRLLEKPALELADVDSVEEFEKQLRDGTLLLRRARVRVRREARGSAVYLTVGAVVPGLVMAVPEHLPSVGGKGVLPARLADVGASKFGGLVVTLGTAASTRSVPVSYAVVAVRGTARPETIRREGMEVCDVRSKAVADALGGDLPRAVPRAVDVVAIVPLSMSSVFNVNKNEVVLVVVRDAVVDADGRVRELVATHMWRLPGGEEGKQLLELFQEEMRRAQALVCHALTMSRKRPSKVGTAEEAAALLVPSSVRLCGPLRR